KSLLEDSSSIKVGSFAHISCCYPNMFAIFPLYYALIRSSKSQLCPSFQLGICIDNDARKMLDDYDVCVQPLMDLSSLANVKLAGPPKRRSLGSLTEMITCKEVF